VLEGDTDAAGSAAEEWFELEPNNPKAAVAAVVAVGIGQGRLGEAVTVAEYALANFPHDPELVNNSAYVLAMSGRAEEAIQLLEPIAGQDFVLNATLGLAYLAHGDLDRGMRLYREAADMAEKIDPAWRSLMTAYQALIVRQLGIYKTSPADVVAALALVPFQLPDDWQERPEFLRIHNICVKYGYDWPLTL
jgi:predicted Zn-dependent protease